MLFLNNTGSIPKIAVVAIIFCGFAVALMLPQYKKHQTLVKARTAAERGKEIAFLLDKYRHQNKRFVPDFSQIELSFACERNGDNTELSCDDYTYRLDNGHILHITHQTLPQRFEIDVHNGTVVCVSEKNSQEGQRICTDANMPNTL